MSYFGIFTELYQFKHIIVIDFCCQYKISYTKYIVFSFLSFLSFNKQKISLEKNQTFAQKTIFRQLIKLILKLLVGIHESN